MISNADYLVGISDAEFERLKLQGSYLEPVTRRMIRAAGIGPGMRVLDIGRGVGRGSRQVSPVRMLRLGPVSRRLSAQDPMGVGSGRS